MHNMTFTHVFGSEKKNRFGPFSYKFCVCIRVGLIHKIRLHSRRGKGMAESFSREKLRHAPQKEMDEKSCVTFLLCDPGWYVQRTLCPE